MGESGSIHALHLPGFSGARLTAIEDAAWENPDWKIAHYRISKFLKALEKEFGISQKQLDAELRKQELWRDFENLFEDPDGEIGKEVSKSYREFVPSFIRTYERLAKTLKRRAEKHHFQCPGIFPLLKWASKAMDVISPSQPHKLLVKMAREQIEREKSKAAGSSKSPA